MKQMKKYVSLLLALVMVMAMTLTVSAATGTDSGQGGTATIKVTLPSWPPGYTGTDTYKVYKVFDATTDGSNISYSLVSGKANIPADSSFVKDDAGNVYIGQHQVAEFGDPKQFIIYIGGSPEYFLPQTSDLSDEQIEAIKNYVSGDTPVATVTVTESDNDFTVTNLQYGYYYITTTTGTVVTVDSTKPNAEVDDKNTVPSLTKKITSVDVGSTKTDGTAAIAQAGGTVSYQVEITVGKGAYNYVFHDTMDPSLSYNSDLVVEVGGTVVSSESYDTTLGAGDTITVKFKDEYLATLHEGDVIKITYSAKVNSDTLSSTSADNSAFLNYGDTNKTNTEQTSVYNAKYKVIKTDGAGAPLAGAGFVLKNNVGKYYKLTGTTTVTWVDDIGDATELTTTAGVDGNIITFTGLSNGEYTLVEKTVPIGYNKGADVIFTIDEANVINALTAVNLEKQVFVVNNAGAELPSTGGIGTTIFYVLGSILLIGAAVLLITKKRMNSDK